MELSATSPTTVLEPKSAKQKYQEARVIVPNDDFNTFQLVSNSLLAIIPGMNEKRSWDLVIKVDKSGSPEVWRGNIEQADFYHKQLVSKGLTIDPVERT